MKRICYITQSNLALTRSHVRGVLKTSNALNQLSDYEVSIMTRSKLSKPLEVIFAEKEINPLSITSLPVSYRDFVQAIIAKRNEIDIIYFRDHKLAPIAFLFRFIFRKKVVFEVHRLAEKWFEPLLWAISKLSANAVVGISQVLIDALHVSSKPTVVAHCGVTEYHLFDYNTSQAELRQELNLPQDGYLVGYAGQLLAYDLNPVFEALQKLQNHHNHNIYMYILGAKTAEVEPLTKQIAEYGLSHQVIVRERVLHNDVMKYYRAADCLIVPFGGDGPGDLPTKCYEYMATERPIVAERNQATVEILHHEKNALLVDALVAQDWYDAFVRLIDDQQLGKQLSEQAFDDGKQYTWEQRGLAIDSILQKI